MKKPARIAMGCLVAPPALFFLVLMVVMLLSSFETSRTWPEPRPDVQLEPSRPDLAEEDVTPDNAYFYIRRMPDGVYPKTEPPDFKWDKATREVMDRFMNEGIVQGATFPDLDSWLSTNKVMIELFRQAAAVSACQVPTITLFYNEVPYIQPIRAFSQGLSYEAEKLAAEGNWDQAYFTLREILRLGDHISRGGTLINHLVKISVFEKTLYVMRRSIHRHQPSNPALKDMTALLDNFYADREPFSEAIRYERCMALSMAVFFYGNPRGVFDYSGDEALEMSTGQRLFFQALVAPLGSTRTRTAEHIDAVYSHLIYNTGEPYDRVRNMTELDKTLEHISKHRFPSNVLGDPVGKLMVMLLAPAMGSSHTKYTEHGIHLKGTMTFLALHRYRLEHDGRLPGTLEELYPVYLPVRPVDDFSEHGKLLRYAAEAGRWRVYSVGPDQMDDGGDAEKDILFSPEEFDNTASEPYEGAGI